jgi:uridine kinase
MWIGGMGMSACMNIVTAADFLRNVNDYCPQSDVVISVAGGSGSGKSFIARKIVNVLGGRAISLDDYIIPEEIIPGANWDLPEVYDMGMARRTLAALDRGESFDKPVYDFEEGVIGEYETVFPGQPIVLEGLHALDEYFRDFIDFGIFVGAGEETRLARRLNRDVAERGKSIEEVRERWQNTVEPTFRKYVVKQAYDADLVVINSDSLM